MRQDFFEFDPTHKLMLAGNSKPGLMSVDEAICRRIALVPFEVQIPKADRDPELALKLRAEWPAILRWMIDGAVAWYAERLKIPEAVQISTQEYLDDQDTLGQWVEERTRIDERAFTRTRDLFADWSVWCKKLNFSPGTEEAFVEDLKKTPLCWTQSRNNKARGFEGVALTDPEQKELQLQRDDGSFSDRGRPDPAPRGRSEQALDWRDAISEHGECGVNERCFQCGEGESGTKGKVKKLKLRGAVGSSTRPLHFECARENFGLD